MTPNGDPLSPLEPVMRPLHIALSGLLMVLGTATAAQADTVFLKDGRILKGRVVDKGDTLFIAHQRFGGLTVDRQDVIRIELDEKPVEAERDFDEVILKDGKIVHGDVRMSADGTEVVVSLGERGEARHPRTAVDRMTTRDAPMRWILVACACLLPSMTWADAEAASSERDLQFTEITEKPVSHQAEIGDSGEFTWWLPQGADEYVLPISAGILVDVSDSDLMRWLRNGSPWSAVGGRNPRMRTATALNFVPAIRR